MGKINPALDPAAKDLYSRLQFYKTLKFYPSDLIPNLEQKYNLVKGTLSQKFNSLYGYGLFDFAKKHNLVGLNSRYAKALADYLTLSKDEKKSYGIKKDLLGIHG